jgi:hypothetical protein
MDAQGNKMEEGREEIKLTSVFHKKLQYLLSF